MRELALRNAQRKRPIRVSLLREITRHLLEGLLSLGSYQLAIQLVSARKMASVNWIYLRHEGSTDVITFDYREGYEDTDEALDLGGEIFISIEDAVRQAEEFSTSWTEELIRYIVHGVLHLRGYDDLTPSERKIMKREENRLVKELTRAFPVEQIAP